MSTQPTDAEIARDVRDLAEALSSYDSRAVLYREIHRVLCSKIDSVDLLTEAVTSIAAVESFRVLLGAVLDGSYHEAGLDSEADEGTADDATPADAETTDDAEEDITPEDALAGLLVSALLKALAPDDDSEASTPDDK